MRNVLRTITSSAALFVALSVLSGCDDAIDVGQWNGPVETLTESGRFSVTVDVNDGTAPVIGENRFSVALAFVADEFEPRPISSANVTGYAYMPEGDHVAGSVETDRVSLGVYTLESLTLDRSGTWQLDIDLEIGEETQEDLSIIFSLEGEPTED